MRWLSGVRMPLPTKPNVGRLDSPGDVRSAIRLIKSILRCAASHLCTT